MSNGANTFKTSLWISRFAAHVEAMEPLLQRLLDAPPVKVEDLPAIMQTAGVYLLSEGDRHLYVGRSNNIVGRLGRHSKPDATHRMASLAYRLAREATANQRAASKDAGRPDLKEDPEFAAAFDQAKAQIRRMDARFIEQLDPAKQALLEIYVAVVLPTRYSDFDNH
jgi:hypothetical protein